MSQFTNYGENKIADWMRGQTLTLPTSWYVAFGSAASDSSFTELALTGLTRIAVLRSLTTFDSTQGDSLASTGTSHRTANTDAIDFGSPSGTVDEATHIGLFDASSSGNCWVWYPLDEPIDVGGSVPIEIAAGALHFILGNATGCSDYLANKFLDMFFRAQSFSWPATLYFSAYTAAPNNAGGGTEVTSSNAYARASLVPSLANISGTQSAGSTLASTGTTGVISNNIDVAYPTPTGAWGEVEAEGIKDAATSGNLLFWGLIGPKTIDAAAPLTHEAGAIVITIA